MRLVKTGWLDDCYCMGSCTRCFKVAKYINELITIIYRYYCDFRYYRCVLLWRSFVPLLYLYMFCHTVYPCPPFSILNVHIAYRFTHERKKKPIFAKRNLKCKMLVFVSLLSVGFNELFLWSHRAINFSMEIDYENSGNMHTAIASRQTKFQYD